MTARRPSPDVVVVGGGLAGITAALDAAGAGATVRLVERRRHLGGATWSFSRNGFTYDNGQHVFLRCCSAYRALLDRLGMTDATRLQERLDLPVLRPGGARERLGRADAPSPFHLAGTLARFHALPPALRAWSALDARALGALSPRDPATRAETFGGWLERRPGPSRAGALHALWEPLLRATCNLPAAELSLALAQRVVGTGLLEHHDAADIGWARVPLGELHHRAPLDALRAAGVEVRLGEAVRAITLDASDATPRIWGPDGDEASPAVVVAVGNTVAGKLLPPGALAHDPARLGTSPIVNVQIVFDRRVMDVELAAVLDSPLEWLFDRSGAVGALPGQQCVGVSLSAADAWVGRRPAALVAEMVQALTALFPGAGRAAVVDAVVTKEPAATFAATPASELERPGTRTRLPGVYLAGAWTDTGWPATMEGAVRSGAAAARAVVVQAGGRSGPGWPGVPREPGAASKAPTRSRVATPRHPAPVPVLAPHPDASPTRKEALA